MDHAEQLDSDAELVDALCAIDEGLSEWEVEFVESVAARVHDDRRVLTEKQRAIAERIRDKKGL